MSKKILNNKKFYIFTIVLIFILIIAILISLSTGSLEIKLQELWNILIGNGSKSQKIALFSIRLPRIIIGLLVGMGLSIAGAILQGITNNDLAEPGILGIGSGSALFVVIYIYLTNGHNYYSINKFTIFTMPIISLIGGLVAAAIIYSLSWKKGLKTNRVLLMGIAINSLFLSLIIIAQLSFNTKDFNQVLAWTSGSIWGASWSYVLAIGPLIFGLSFIAIYLSRYLDVFTLGDEISTGLGVKIERDRRLLIILAVGLSGCATAVAGSVAFVGLISPHIAKKLIGPKHKYSLIISALVGMILVVFSDAIARSLFAPIELHLGLVTSIIGVPYFIYLMLKQ